MIGREGLAQHGYGGVCWAVLGSMVRAETGNAGRAHGLVGKPDSIQVLVNRAPEQRLGGCRLPTVGSIVGHPAEGSRPFCPHNNSGQVGHKVLDELWVEFH